MGFRRNRKATSAMTVIAIIVSTTLVVGGRGFFSYGSGSTLVSGEVSENTVWVVAGSPYVVMGNITVRGGVVLTVESGVEVRFDDHFSMFVYGSLRVTGEGNASAVFTSNKVQPLPGDWKGIEFVGTQSESIYVGYAVIEYAITGLFVQSLGKVLIENSRIVSNAVSGIHVEGESDVEVRDSVLEYNGNGISSSGQRVSGIRAVGNLVRFNGKGMDFEAWAPQAAMISDMDILNNTFSLNGNGLYFHIFAGSQQYLDTEVIRDVRIMGNVASYNSGYGVYMYSGGPWLGSIYEVVISGNRVFSNRDGLYLFAKAHSVAAVYDVVLLGNSVTGNSGKGITVSGGVLRPTEQGIKTNMTGNLVAYNGYGVFYDGDTENVAHHNDVYGNVYGMNVSGGAVVNAELNFWGLDGPFHPLLNSAGKGNSVNGDGADLVFQPYLATATANRRPVAVLEASKTVALVGESIVLNASGSSDDGRVVGFFFGFGDGLNSGWVVDPVVVHAYNQSGSFEVSLRVVDDLGFESVGVVTLVVRVQRALIPVLSLGSDGVRSGDNLVVTVHVTDGVDAVSDAFVTLVSGPGWVFSPVTGRTDLGGDFVSVSVAPSVSEQMFVDIAVKVSKDGYWSGEGSKLVAVFPSEAAWDSYVVAAGVIVAVIVAVAVFLVLRKRKRR